MNLDWMPYEEYCDMVSEKARAIHKSYLHSNEWKERREIVLLRDNYLCQDCLRIAPKLFEEMFKKIVFINIFELNIDCNIKASQVHHLTYDNLHTQQEENDCISLCEFCHKIKHSELRYDYKNNVIKRDANIEKIIMLRILKHPEIIKLDKKLHDNFLNSITRKPIQFLNEVENDKRDK